MEESYAEIRLRKAKEEAKERERIEFEAKLEKARLDALKPPRVGTGLPGPGKPKGSPKTGGRKKGSKNKFTRVAKDHFVDAFENSGGASALSVWAKENRTDFYKLYARLIPQEKEIGGPKGDPIPVKMDIEFVKT